MKSIAAAFLILASSTIPAWAVLGQSRDSVRSDAQSLKGTLTTTEMSGYSVHQIQRNDGVVLKEFVSPEGKVFGISWRGPTMPNLPQLLGGYFPAFNQANQSTHRRGPLSIHAGPLVVETGGHPRAFRVRAYVANLLPSGISQDVVQ
jgi:Protein of unknown function (DUF2844)